MLRRSLTVALHAKGNELKAIVFFIIIIIKFQLCFFYEVPNYCVISR